MEKAVVEIYNNMDEENELVAVVVVIYGNKVFEEMEKVVVEICNNRDEENELVVVVVIYGNKVSEEMEKAVVEICNNMDEENELVVVVVVIYDDKVFEEMEEAVAEICNDMDKDNGLVVVEICSNMDKVHGFDIEVIYNSKDVAEKVAEAFGTYNGVTKMMNHECEAHNQPLRQWLSSKMQKHKQEGDIAPTLMVFPYWNYTCLCFFQHKLRNVLFI
ncbi:hypothetical protein FXO38_08351 [Capsicum annuum]|nr:hypothetical protein FXO37_20931 [Capsicum annuum]KAF3667904.1 hypothetical protein FXO38_08351 [Capsicum annuum]